MRRIADPLGARAGAMQHRRNIELAELLIKRIPIAIAQAWRLDAAILERIGVDEAADEAELLDAALEFRQSDGDRLSRNLRQHADAGKAVGEHLHLAVDDVMRFLVEPLNDLPRLLAMHHLKRARRDELEIGAVLVEE